MMLLKKWNRNKEKEEISNRDSLLGGFLPLDFSFASYNSAWELSWSFPSLFCLDIWHLSKVGFLIVVFGNCPAWGYLCFSKLAVQIASIYWRRNHRWNTSNQYKRSQEQVPVSNISQVFPSYLPTRKNCIQCFDLLVVCFCDNSAKFKTKCFKHGDNIVIDGEATAILPTLAINQG